MVGLLGGPVKKAGESLRIQLFTTSNVRRSRSCVSLTTFLLLLTGLKLLFENDLAETLFQFFCSVLCVSADREDLGFLEARLELLDALPGAGQVHLVCDDNPRTLAQCRIVEVELAPEILQIGDWFAAFTAGHIEDENEQFAADDMAQKVVPQSYIFVGTLNETGDVSNCVPAIARVINDT